MSPLSAGDKQLSSRKLRSLLAQKPLAPVPHYGQSLHFYPTGVIAHVQKTTKSFFLQMSKVKVRQQNTVSPQAPKEGHRVQDHSPTVDHGGKERKPLASAPGLCLWSREPALPEIGSQQSTALHLCLWRVTQLKASPIQKIITVSLLCP